MSEYDFPLAQFANVDTPFYHYDLDLLDTTLRIVKKASDIPGFKVHYALKANTNPTLLKHIAAAGLGADTVSGGEIRAAIEAGFQPSSIVFAGVGKTDREIRYALENGIGCFNAESVQEINAIESIARQMGVVASVALRVNPEVDAHTHHYITTGLSENKFGIAMSMLDSAISLCTSSKWIAFRGFHFHIGSQVTDLTPYRVLCERIVSLQEKYPDLDIPSINVGGGLGIDYNDPERNPIPDFKGYFDIFRRNLPLSKGQELHFELGRSIVAQCGSLITRVTYVKEGIGRRFVIVDAGMTDLIRPALYQAHHHIENISSPYGPTERYDVVGPICESSDTFATDICLPHTSRGDLLAIRSAGAYGEVMASRYNCRELPGTVFSSRPLPAAK